jgi:plasmid stability protein
MADLLVRNVPEHIMARLKQQAERNHRSMQKEAVAILEAGTELTMQEWLERVAVTREASKSWGPAVDSTELIREDRDSR